MLHLIHLIFKIIEGVTKHAQKNQDEPRLPDALYTRRFMSTLQYIDIATKAMISEGKKEEDVKTMLINKGLPEDHLDIILGKAKLNYKNWLNDTATRPPLSSFELYEQLTKSTLTPKPTIKVIKHRGEDHALHFCCLIDFKRYYELNGRSLLYATTNRALSTTPTIQNEDVAIRQSSLAKAANKSNNNPYLRAVTISGEREAVYPYLKTNSKTRFYTQQIVEWENGEPIVEAEIEGSLNKDLPLNFFATDYAVNKQIYQSQSSIEIGLSALVLELFKSDKDTNDINQQPKGIWINRNYNSKSYFSFEGVILEINSASIDALTLSCIMKLKLGKSDWPGTDLVVDAYVTNSNIKTDKIQAGMLVQGILWFQGEIVVS